MSIDDRYDRKHRYGEVIFELCDYTPDIEECRMLMLKMLEQGIRDYISLYKAELPSDQLAWEEAKGFLFNDDYQFEWGDMNLTLEDMLDILDLDIKWARERILERFKKARG